MSTKIHSHHSANNMFKNDGVRSKIVMDGDRGEIMGKFKEARQDATVQVQQIKNNTPQSTVPKLPVD